METKISVSRDLQLGSDFYRQECDRLRAINAELVAALEKLLNTLAPYQSQDNRVTPLDTRIAVARVALTKAKEQ